MHISRTYSTKGAKRRVLGTGLDEDDANGFKTRTAASDDFQVPPRKKQRVQVEVVQVESDHSDEDSDDFASKPRSKLARSLEKGTNGGWRRRSGDQEPGLQSDSDLRVSLGKPNSSRPPNIKLTSRMSPRKQPSNAGLPLSGSSAKLHDNGSPSPTKLTKKMLGRSHTEPSMSLNNGSAIGGSSSFSQSSQSSTRKPLSPSKSLPSTLFDTEDPPISHSQPPRPKPRSSNSTHVRTYGGASRSYLVALPTSTLGVDQDEDDMPRESYSSLRTRWGIDKSEDDMELPETSTNSGPNTPSKNKGKGKSTTSARPVQLPHGMMNDLRSITELRSKGESRRFLDEVGYLFEGLEPGGPIGLRRASAIEVVTKLCDVQFARKAKAADFLSKTWDVLHAAGDGRADRVLDLALVTFVALVARDASALEDLVASASSGPQLCEVLFEFLGTYPLVKDGLSYVASNLTPAELKRLGLSRNEFSQLKSLHKLITTQSSIFSYDIEASTRLLISLSLSVLTASHLPTSRLPQLLTSVKESLTYFHERLEAYTSGLSLVPPSDSPAVLPSQLLHAENCLRLLESFTLDHWLKDEDSAVEVLSSQRHGWLLDGLLSLSVVCEIIQRLPDPYVEDVVQQASTCSDAVFRLLMSLTHDDPEWCRALLEQELGPSHIMRTIVRMHTQTKPKAPITIKQEKARQARPSDVDLIADDAPGDAQAMDRLCLALALLTNLVQGCDSAMDTFRFLHLDSDCKLKRSCIRSCSCPNAVNSLIILCGLYVDYFKSDTAPRSISTEYLSGHLSILLGMLMQNSEANQVQILAALPGPTDRSKLAQMVDHSKEFTAFYKSLMIKLQQLGGASVDADDGDGRGDSARSTQMEAIPDTRRTREAGEKIDATAKEIIAFLEGMRNRCTT